jgi:hypothetical protein
MATKKNTTKGVKKGTRRGPYKKKWTNEDHKQAIQNLKLLEPDILLPNKQIPVKEEASMNEIDFLAIFCDNFNKYDEDAKERIMDFLSGKYRKYIHYSPKQ